MAPNVGTIFALHRRKGASGPATAADRLQKGQDLVAAGYIVYSASTMLVYSAGHGVHGFTLDRSVGEFLTSHPDLRIPPQGRYYSVDLIYYPANSKDETRSQGKLRLLYEAAPLAFIAEQAGGYASDGARPILSIQPSELHQRTPLFIGSRELVEKAEEFIRKHG